MSNVLTEQIADEAALWWEANSDERERAADLLRKADDELSASESNAPNVRKEKEKRATKELQAQAWLYSYTHTIH
jgi:hypothetical protein